MELLDQDATAQAELVRRGEVAPVELVRASIDAIERLDPQLDAMLHRAFDYALSSAEAPVDKTAPFCGVPTVLKDYGQHVAGFPFSYGALPFLREKPIISEHDSNFAADMRRAGLVFLGRANTSLCGAFFPTHDIDAHVMPRNPWNPDYSTGGSSSGSAAAVAARLVAISHGNDGGGSIRLPASLCGIVGMKPTRGRVSIGPDRTEVMSFGTAWGHEFVMSRSVRDTATMLNAVQGWRPGDSLPIQPAPVRTMVRSHERPLRIGLATTPYMADIDADPACVRAAEETARVLADLGHRVEVADPPRYDLSAVEWDYGEPGAPAYATMARSMDNLGKLIGRPVTEDDIGPQLWALVEMGRSYSGMQVLEFAEVMQRHVVAWDMWWQESGLDLLLSPTVATTTVPMSEYLPPPHGTFVIPDDNPLIGVEGLYPLIAFTQIFNWTGQPAISLPLVTGEHDLPIGVQLGAARMHDDLVLRVAFELEEAMPWAHRRPRVCAR